MQQGEAVTRKGVNWTEEINREYKHEQERSGGKTAMDPEGGGGRGRGEAKERNGSLRGEGDQEPRGFFLALRWCKFLEHVLI